MSQKVGKRGDSLHRSDPISFLTVSQHFQIWSRFPTLTGVHKKITPVTSTSKNISKYIIVVLYTVYTSILDILGTRKRLSKDYPIHKMVNLTLMKGAKWKMQPKSHQTNNQPSFFGIILCMPQNHIQQVSNIQTLMTYDIQTNRLVHDGILIMACSTFW